MAKIIVDIDELIDKLDAMTEDDFVQAILEISEDEYTSELVLSAVSIDEDEPISYGSIPEASEDFI
jgi:hypothetical protein